MGKTAILVDGGFHQKWRKAPAFRHGERQK